MKEKVAKDERKEKVKKTDKERMKVLKRKWCRKVLHTKIVYSPAHTENEMKKLSRNRKNRFMTAKIKTQNEFKFTSNTFFSVTFFFYLQRAKSHVKSLKILISIIDQCLHSFNSIFSFCLGVFSLFLTTQMLISFEFNSLIRYQQIAHSRASLRSRFTRIVYENFMLITTN